jgi:hypothetical protein
MEKGSKLEVSLLRLCIRLVTPRIAYVGSWKMETRRLFSLEIPYFMEVRLLFSSNVIDLNS